jgi:hypothetical protein
MLSRRATLIFPTGTHQITRVIFQRYVYARKPDIKAYLRQHLIKECNKPHGLVSRSAVFAIMMYVNRPMFADFPTHSTFKRRVS